MVFGRWYLVFSRWYLVFGIWYLVVSIWSLVFGRWYLVMKNKYPIIDVMNPKDSNVYRKRMSTHHLRPRMGSNNVGICTFLPTDNLIFYLSLFRNCVLRNCVLRN
jgi:hypothetical protein